MALETFTRLKDVTCPIEGCKSQEDPNLPGHLKGEGSNNLWIFQDQGSIERVIFIGECENDHIFRFNIQLEQFAIQKTEGVAL